MAATKKQSWPQSLARFSALIEQHQVDVHNPDNFVRQADVEQMLKEGSELEQSTPSSTLKTTKGNFEEFKKELLKMMPMLNDGFKAEIVSSAEVNEIMEKNAGQDIQTSVIIGKDFSTETLKEKIENSDYRKSLAPEHVGGKKFKK